MSTRDERGAATLLVVALGGLLLVVALALSGVAGLVVAHRRAQAAADLAALAGAGAISRGEAPCVAAVTVAASNGASLSSCQVSGRVVEVAVLVPGPRFWGRHPDLTARARAGPI